jgi:hypothetical protein
MIGCICNDQRERLVVCFSATANFVGSGVLGSIGVVTLSRVKHKRELLFASLPTLFALHQFMEGFVWLGAGRIYVAKGGT